MPEIRKRALALGTFDGVHLAHRTLVESAAREAGTSGATAITFDRLPGSLLGKNGKTRQIVTLGDKIELLKRAGAGEVEVLRFDETLSNMEPEDFFEEHIVRKFKPATLTVGHDYRFGKHGRGDVALLERLCSNEGMEITVLEEIIKGGIRISSTDIRKRIASGQPEEAASMLGRVHFFKLQVLSGELVPLSGIELPPCDVAFKTALFENMPLLDSMEGLVDIFRLHAGKSGPRIELSAKIAKLATKGAYMLFGPRV